MSLHKYFINITLFLESKLPPYFLDDSTSIISSSLVTQNWPGSDYSPLIGVNWQRNPRSHALFMGQFKTFWLAPMNCYTTNHRYIFLKERDLLPNMISIDERVLFTTGESMINAISTSHLSQSVQSIYKDNFSGVFDIYVCFMLLWNALHVDQLRNKPETTIFI